MPVGEVAVRGMDRMDCRERFVHWCSPIYEFFAGANPAFSPISEIGVTRNTQVPIHQGPADRAQVMQFVAVGLTVLGSQFMEAKHLASVLCRNGIPPITLHNHR